jgi:alpha-N-arabinofuranosidase
MQHTHLIRKYPSTLTGLLLAVLGATTTPLFAQSTNSETAGSVSNAPAAIPVLQIKADQAVAKASPTLYGLMTEEINYSYEGGLYGELIRNRTFKANPTNAVYWNTVGNGSISLDTTAPLNEALNVSLKVDASQASKDSPAGIANGGFWGIPVKPKTEYHASFYAKSDGKFSGPLTVSLANTNGKTVFASAKVAGITGDWQKYEVRLTTKNVKPSKDNRLVITVGGPGTIWFQQVSLFPPTFNNRPNGNRPDIMQLLADMKPKFLRFPGGNYLEGNTIETRFNWKNTVGDISQRPGHLDDGWGYWSTDGLGLLEFLEWCEDLKMQPLLAVYAGYSMRQPHVAPGADLEPYVQDALDEIEYATGDVNTKWGAQRARDGHPAPFPLNYIEVGNEDNFDRSGSYDARYTQFYDAIKAKHPNLQIIATARVTTRTPDLTDEHLYPNSEGAMEARAHEFDNHARTGPKIFVGEWATRVGAPTPNMAGALGDAAWMTGMERNSDIVLMGSYAPLFVNVSNLKRDERGRLLPDDSMQWPTDLIGYDALTSYGSPSYYAQQMFSTHHGDVILATDATDIPMKAGPSTARRGSGTNQPAASAQQLPAVFYSVTRDSSSGTIYAKIVNTLGMPQPVKIEISGVASVASSGEAVVMKANSPDDTNSITQPTHVVPVTEKVKGLGASFTREFPPYSITILELKAK